MFPRDVRESKPYVRALYRIALPLALAVWLVPILMIAYTSARSASELNLVQGWGWPSLTQLLDNYNSVFTTTPMARFLFNSLVITAVSVAGALVVSIMAGFALAKYQFPGNRLILATFIAGNFVPFQALMIPVRDLMINIVPLYNSYLGLIVFHIAFQAGFSTFFVHNFVRELPNDYIDAARLDGASEFAILWWIVVPMIKPGLAALAILEITFIWNDYFWSLVLVQSDSVRPVTAGLQTLKGFYVSSWNLLSAGAIVAALPPVAIFFVLQRQFSVGLVPARGADGVRPVA